MERHRVLVIAEAANPEWASVPLEGWSHSRALAEVADVHLVTQVRNRASVLRAGLVEHRDFTAIDSEAIARPLSQVSSLLRGGAGKGWTTITALEGLSYYYFEHLVWRQFSDRIVMGKFDIVHRLTPLSPTIPSILAAKCKRVGVPFVLGPLNGGVAWPPGFRRRRWQEREWLSYLRGAYKLMPHYHSTRENASAIIIGSMDTWKQIPECYRHKCVYIPENGLCLDRFNVQRSRQPSRPLRAIFVGRLTPYKGADMAIESAAPLIRERVLVLEIVGDGPQMGDLRRLAAREGIEEGVSFSGWVNHSDVQRKLVESDVFVFPSIREFGGAVVLEAMAMGVVPIVVKYGGPGELATPATGFFVEPGPRDRIIRQFGSVLRAIASDPEQIKEKGAQAQRLVHERFTWQAKARQVQAVYRWVLRQQAERPNFGMPLAETPESV